MGLRGRTVLLGVTGSIAVYKACDLVRRLKDEGADVHCLMTSGAQRFVAPLTFGALSGNPVATEIWDPHLWKMAHLSLAESADIYLIAPCSTDTLARLAAGMSGDIITATAAATRAPVLIAPAMHESMWLHPATRSNVQKLKSYGYRFVGPEKGELLSGKPGWGRFSDASSIISAVKKAVR